MAKNVLKQIVGTVAQATVVVVGGAIIIGSIPFPGGHAARHTIGHGMPHVVEDIEKWKNEKSK